MRKYYISFVLIIIALTGCTNYTYRYKCAKDELYGEHSFVLISNTVRDQLPNMAFLYWFVEKCENCGLERAINPMVMSSDGTIGTVYIYKSPNTNKFDDWCVKLDDADLPVEEQYKTIRPDSIIDLSGIQGLKPVIVR